MRRRPALSPFCVTMDGAIYLGNERKRSTGRAAPHFISCQAQESAATHGHGRALIENLGPLLHGEIGISRAAQVNEWTVATLERRMHTPPAGRGDGPGWDDVKGSTRSPLQTASAGWCVEGAEDATEGGRRAGGGIMLACRGERCVDATSGGPPHDAWSLAGGRRDSSQRSSVVVPTACRLHAPAQRGRAADSPAQRAAAPRHFVHAGRSQGLSHLTP